MAQAVLSTCLRRCEDWYTRDADNRRKPSSELARLRSHPTQGGGQGQAAIITVEAITKQPRAVGDDAIAVRSVVMLCLSFDHRVLDGHQAGAFLRDVKKRLEAITPDTGID